MTSRDLTKQEGLPFRHLLKMILLCGEFSQVTPIGMDGVRAMSARLVGEAVRGALPTNRPNRVRMTCCRLSQGVDVLGGL